MKLIAILNLIQNKFICLCISHKLFKSEMKKKHHLQHHQIYAVLKNKSNNDVQGLAEEN